MSYLVLFMYNNLQSNTSKNKIRLNYQLLKNLKNTIHSLILYIFVIREGRYADPENE